MQLEDLIPFGRLDSQMDDDGFIIVHKYKNFIPEFLEEVNFFLVLKDNSVRYVTLEEVQFGKFVKLKFKRSYFIKDMLDDDLVRIMLPKDVIDDILKNTGIEAYKGLAVYVDKIKLGVVKDDFFNGAQTVLEIVLDSGKEILIPLVDKYLEHISDDEIHLTNIGEFLEL